MSLLNVLNTEIYRRQTNFTYRNNWQRLHLDPILLGLLALLIVVGFMILYSASNENTAMLTRQATRFGLAIAAMLVCAQIPPSKYKLWAPWLFCACLGLLISVLVMGKIGKGAQRWLDVGLLRFQPSEMMKIAVPLVLAWYFGNKALPPAKRYLIFASLLTLGPTLLIAKQPDLGTALMIGLAGGTILLFAGMSWRLLFSLLALIATSVPVLWHFLHNYQRQRVLTFLNPERDPLGSGYHIIQSKIAIGSGSLFGKGWLNGSQSHLNFLPEHATDFIFAVLGEEFGLLGCLFLLLIYLAITTRCLYIANQAQDNFGRLLAGGLSLLFFLSAFVNIGMVVGILPVVGLPLPLVSYGGTAMVTTMASFGILMSIHTHRKLLAG